MVFSRFYQRFPDMLAARLEMERLHADDPIEHELLKVAHDGATALLADEAERRADFEKAKR